MPSTVFAIGNKKVTLKYTRKMPRGEVERMKSFVTKNGTTLVKTPKFKILSVTDDDTKRVFKVVL
jgi:cephalosporin-C deacetylase-like acetyl esterase